MDWVEELAAPPLELLVDDRDVMIEVPTAEDSVAVLAAPAFELVED